MRMSTVKTPISEEGWSIWKPWYDFPHQHIQLGMSNLEYGGLMDIECIYFGSVGDENDVNKSEFPSIELQIILKI